MVVHDKEVAERMGLGKDGMNGINKNTHTWS
jgi:hypothetical protein